MCQHKLARTGGIQAYRQTQQVRHISIEPQSPPATAKNAMIVEAVKEAEAVLSGEAAPEAAQYTERLAVPLPPLLESFALAAVSGKHDSAVSDALAEKFGDDLQSIDNSIGSAKRRVHKWFASGQIWQSALLRVYETSDTLIDTAIVERTFEEAELSMVHATGRLNEKINGIAKQLARETAELDSVWQAQSSLQDAEFVDRIPAYVRWSLAQFWAINTAGVAGAVAGAAMYGVPAVYASTGGVGALVMAFVWLGRRWSLLESSIYSSLDSEGKRLRRDLMDVFRSEVRSALDAPVIDAIDSSPLIRKA
ncbi:hypothetical protein FBU59_003895 [Linderina macrospora]|uniref:Uncharacterized protein n=1 Tax=Linderina macrospora TaxID=4868 RepID=A0ACC1J6Y7_9FUNG|nr:hypothetical protein FBU59_003895 [Linderina macrospora]